MNELATSARCRVLGNSCECCFSSLCCIYCLCRLLGGSRGCSLGFTCCKCCSFHWNQSKFTLKDDNDDKTAENRSSRIFWLLDNVNDKKISELRQFNVLESNQLQVFGNAVNCIEAINSLTTSRHRNDRDTILIVSGNYVTDDKTFVNFESEPRIKAIYILDNIAGEHVQEHKKIKSLCSKIRQIFFAINPLINELQTLGENYYCNIPFNTISPRSTERSVRDLAVERTTFPWTHTMIDNILEMPQPETARSDFINYCKETYKNNTSALVAIENFEHTYIVDEALKWYFKPSFFFEITNQTLRTHDADGIYRLRMIINDIHKQIRQEYEKNVNFFPDNFTVYHGQRISTDELQKLKSSVGGLVVQNRFLSTTTNRDIALIFAGGDISLDPNVNECFLLYEINIHTKSCAESSPFVDLRTFSAVRDEQEILFLSGSLFEVGSVTPDSTNEDLWNVKLKTIDAERLPDIKPLKDELNDEPSDDAIVNPNNLGSSFETLKDIDLAQSQDQLPELSNDPKPGIAERGWSRKEINAIKKVERCTTGHSPEMELAHASEFEAEKGFSYKHAKLQLSSLHKLQDKHDKKGRLNKTPLCLEEFIKENSIDKNTKEGQSRIREHHQQMMNRSWTSSSFRLEHEKHSRHFQNDRDIKLSQYIDYVKPGGIELCHPLQLSSGFRFISQTVVKSVNIEPSTRSVLVQTSKGAYRYTPADLTLQELLCLEAAVNKTTKNGIMFSLEREYHILDGVVSTMEGAKQIETTLTEADYLLCDLAYGIDYTTGTKTASISTYESPLDVRCRMLMAAGQGNDSISNRAYSIYSKFRTVTPYPTFQMNSSVKARLNSTGAKITVDGPLLQIGMRGIYSDWFGNVYYDEKSECCLEQEPFLQDFVKNYTGYIRHYPVLARLEQYATVIGLLLSYPSNSTLNRIEAYRRYRANYTPKFEISAEVITARLEATEAKHKAAAAQEALIEFEPDALIRLYMALYAAQTWFELEEFLRAKDAALLVLLYAENFSEDIPETLINQLCSKALLLIARVLKIATVPSNEITLTNITTEEVSELQKLLLTVGNTSPEAIMPQHSTNIRRCFNKALDASLQLAIQVEDWATAYEVARFAATNWLEEHDSAAEETQIAEAWNAWKNSTGLKLNRSSNLSTIMRCLWPSPHSSADGSSEAECSDPSILTKFLRCLDIQVLVDPEVINQFSGFVYFVDAGIQLKATARNEREQYYAALASCLCALRCFCGCFDLELAAGINWKQVASASTMRLAEVCNVLYWDAEQKELKQGLDEAIKERELLQKNALQANVDKILLPLHKLREKKKRNRLGEDLVAVDKLIIETYKSIGDKEKTALWQRILETDSVEYSIGAN